MKNYFFFMLAFILAGTVMQAKSMTCSEPTDVQIQRLNGTTATIDANGGTVYDIFLNIAGGPGPVANQGPNYGLEDLTFPFTNDASTLPLSSHNAYDVWIRTQCAGETSAWVGPYRVDLYDSSCTTPSNFEVERTSGTETVFTADAGTYDFYIVPENDAAPANIWTGPNALGDNNIDLSSPYTKTGLDPYVAYDIYVRTQCNASQVSEWEGPYNIPAFACTNPTGIVITRSADNRSASITADEIGSSVYYDTYVVIHDGVPPSPTSEPNVYGNNNINFPFSRHDLSIHNEYDVYVRKDCGGTTSDWVGPFYVPLYGTVCQAPDYDDIILTRLSPSAGQLSGLDASYNYQATLNIEGGPLREHPNFIMDINTIPHIQYGLNNTIAFSVWVRTVCPDGSISEWTGPKTLPMYVPTPMAPLKVSPNPVNNGLVKIQGMDATKVQVINLNGKVEINTTVTNNEFYVNGLAPGQYIVKATDSSGNTTSTKLIKK